MMAQLIDRKHLKQEMKELLRSAQVSPRGMTCAVSGPGAGAEPGGQLPGLLRSRPAGHLRLHSHRPDEHGPGAGFVLYCMAIRRGERAEYLTLFDGFSFVGKVIGLNIVI